QAGAAADEPAPGALHGTWEAPPVRDPHAAAAVADAPAAAAPPVAPPPAHPVRRRALQAIMLMLLALGTVAGVAYLQFRGGLARHEQERWESAKKEYDAGA